MSAAIEDRITAVASRQLGLVTRAQLLEMDVTASGVDRRLKAKRLRAVHRGVYLVGPLLPVRAREMAAVLASGERAVVSHRSVAWLRT